MAGTPNWVPGALIPSSFESIGLVNGTSVAIGFNSTTQECDAVHISVETNDARYRYDSTGPTATTGVLLQKDMDYWFKGLHKPSNDEFLFMADAGTGVIQLVGYKYKG